VTDASRRLIWYGMFLFLLGLLTGFVEPKFANPRMGLAAHLEGVMNGIFLVALGAAWAHVRLSPGLSSTAYWTALYGTYANWAVTSLAAILGTAALSPITGAGHGATVARGDRHGRFCERVDRDRGVQHSGAMGVAPIGNAVARDGESTSRAVATLPAGADAFPAEPLSRGAFRPRCPESRGGGGRASRAGGRPGG